jgi:hypothetical protein
MRIHKRTLSLLTLWAIRVASIVIIFGGYYTYYWTPFFAITTYTIVGIDQERADGIRIQLAALAQGSHLLVLPNDKILTYNNSGIIAAVRANVPEMETISMRPVGLHTVHVEVTLLKPALQMGDGKALTKDGVIFSTKKDISTYPLLSLASSTEEVTSIDGLPFKHLMWKDIDVGVSFLGDLLSMSSKVSSVVFPVTSVLVEEGGDVTLTNASGTSKVLFLQQADQKKVWTTLVSAIDTDPLKSKLEHNRDGLLYLDVRYGNKVFYRFNDMAFQNNGLTAILDNHASSTTATTTTH